MPPDDIDGVSVSTPQSQPRSERPGPLTHLACASAIFITLGIMAESSEPSWAQLAKWGYVPAERIWDGALWALTSSAFVHLALWHLVFNVYWLWRFGGVVERALGSTKFLAFLIAAATTSSAFQLAVSDSTGIGASGIVYALFGLMWRSKERIPRFAEVLGPDTVSLFLVWLIGCVVATWLGFANVGNAAHITGLVFGALVADWHFRQSNRWLAASGTGFMLALSLLAACANPWSERWLEHHAMKLHRRGEYQRAALTYHRSLEFGADSAWAFHNLALTYASLGDWDRCGKAIESLRKVSPAEADSLDHRLRNSTP